MARLFGFIGNRPELGPKVLERYANDLRVELEPGESLGWGVGFYQSGEVLLRRRHLDHRRDVDPQEITENLTADVLIGHVRKPTVGNLKTDNAHPFRYRQWLFAQIGTPSAFAKVRTELLGVLPAFLRPNVRGDTDSEVLFYLILSCLHDQGQLDNHHVSEAETHKALRSALRLVNDVCSKSGVPEYSGDTLLTNGETLIACHQSGKMAYRLIDSAEEVEDLLATDSERVVHASRARCCVLASEVEALPQGWLRLEPDTLVTLSRLDGPVSEPLGLRD